MVSLLLSLKAIDPVCLFSLTREALLEDMLGPFGSSRGREALRMSKIKDRLQFYICKRTFVIVLNCNITSEMFDSRKRQKNNDCVEKTGQHR